MRSPELFAAWLYQANLATLARGPSLAAAAYAFKTLAWFAFPAWPIALWALWLYRRKPGWAGVSVPLIALIAGLGIACLALSRGELPLLPLLLPLALLGGQVLHDLRRGAANSLAWFGTMTFSLLGGLICLGYYALQTGFPPRIAANAVRLEPGFVAQFTWLPLIAAAAITLAWIALILTSERSPQRSVIFWAAGLALFWALTMLLWLPWIDYGKSYRKVAQALQASLPKHPGCIASQDLGEAQRAAFDYHAGIVTERIEIGTGHDCRLLLIQDNAGRAEPDLAGHWKKIWEGNRAGDRSEKFRLYAKERAAP